MVSKRSCFNPTLMRRDLLRFWPCWAATLVIALLLLPIDMASQMDRWLRNDLFFDAANAASLVCNQFEIVVIAACGLGILVACLLSRHLFTARAVNFFHALPIRREGLLITNVVTGIIMLWGPILITALVTLLVELAYGVFDPLSLGQLLLLYLCASTLFFAMGLFCCHLTGMVVSAVGLYVILNAVFYIGPAVISSLMSIFVLGYDGLTLSYGSMSVVFRFLTPLVNILGSCSTTHLPYADTDYTIARLQNMDLLLLYAAVGIAILAVTLLLYRHRRSERAGDLLAFGWLRPVFKVCAAILGGAALTIAILAIYGMEPSFAVVAVLCVVWSLVCWMVAEMLVHKSLRVFKKKAFLQWGLTALCGILLLVGLRLDIFGIERRVPQTDEITSVSLWINGRYASPDDPALMQQIIDLHQTVVDHRDELREVDEYDYTTNIQFDYSLDDGISTLERSYNVPDIREGDTPNAYQQALYALLRDPDMVMEFYFDGPLTRETEIKLGDVNYYDTQNDRHENLNLTQAQAWKLYKAIEADIYAGNVTWAEGYNFEDLKKYNDDATWYTNVDIQLHYIRHEEEQTLLASDRIGTVGYEWVSFDVTRGMANTIAALEELGLAF